jgi:hypothetical protein
MNFRIFLDDIRDVRWVYPDDSHNWHICRSFNEFIDTITSLGFPDMVSFDHDLGENVPTGMDAAKHLVELDLNTGDMPDKFFYTVHSANPVGAANIRGLLENYLNSKKE